MHLYLHVQNVHTYIIANEVMFSYFLHTVITLNCVFL